MTCGYGGPDIVTDCSISSAPAGISVIVGPNGAGKSTAMKALFGLLPLRAGRVELAGEDISRLPPRERVARGMAFVPQNRNVFPALTVEENLEMGAFLRRDNIEGSKQGIFDLFPILSEKRLQRAGNLSGGQRQQVALGRALMTQPDILMLDEPTAGVSPIIMDEILDQIVRIAASGVSVLMVEQNARQALAIADQGYVLVQGRNRYSGDGATLLNDENVRKSFLGG